jgi:hypothetical protein
MYSAALVLHLQTCASTTHDFSAALLLERTCVWVRWFLSLAGSWFGKIDVLLVLQLHTHSLLRLGKNVCRLPSSREINVYGKNLYWCF